MPKQQVKRNSPTRSISFDADMFELMEARRAELRMDRSAFIVALLEDTFDVLKHPEIHDAAHKADETKLKAAREARKGKH